jgi:hypothetical protein
MVVKLSKAAHEPTTPLTLPASVEEGEQDLAEAYRLVTEARKIFDSRSFYVTQLEHLADVCFIRLGNARPQSSGGLDDNAVAYRAPCYLSRYKD